jgi:hypothetical protein
MKAAAGSDGGRGGAQASDVEAVGGLDLGGPALLVIDDQAVLGGDGTHQQRALLGLEAADGVDEATAGAQALQAAAEQAPLQVRRRRRCPRGERSSAARGDGRGCRARCTARRARSRRSAADRPRHARRRNEGAVRSPCTLRSSSSGTSRPPRWRSSICASRRSTLASAATKHAAALHQLGEVQGLGAHAAASVEHLFSGTWREGQGSLLRAEALHREVTGVVERVLVELAAGADAQGLGLARDGLDAGAGVGAADGLGDDLGGGAREVDAEIDRRRRRRGPGRARGRAPARAA